jgi:hypothetical protein
LGRWPDRDAQTQLPKLLVGIDNRFAA